MGILISVSGAVGGIGTSTLAIAIAQQAVDAAVVIDAQPSGVPLDVLLGAEATPGARWSQVRLASAEVDTVAALQALPEHSGVRVLASDADSVAEAGALALLAPALRDALELTVLDAPFRLAVPDVMPDARVLLLPPTLLGVAAAAIADPGCLLVTVDTGAGELPQRSIEDYLGRQPVAHIRWQRGVTEAARGGTPPPPSSDVMRAAAAIVRLVRHGA